MFSQRSKYTQYTSKGQLYGPLYGPLVLEPECPSESPRDGVPSCKRYYWNRRACFAALLGFLLFIFVSSLWAEDSEGTAIKRMYAVRSESSPRIDGLLSDTVWQIAPAATGFTQSEPNKGQPATERTTIQVAYDGRGLYIGIMAYDSQPDKITARLYPRDQISMVETDWVRVSIDTHHDHQTGRYFVVSPSGALSDGVIANDSELRSTWDGVWIARVAVHQEGWSVEYQIPYHVLRFNSKDAYTWGINIDRFISRKQERDMWVMVPKEESGWVSQFGHLEGIEGIHPPAYLELVPFTLAQHSFAPEGNTISRELQRPASLGFDLRYGLSSSFSLNASANPDFGQVEADPAELNLTAFETFFEERRPFFVEGSSVFENDGYQLFYSRRIGRPPGHFSVPPGVQVVERPDATTILGAVKLVGKTVGKASIGILNAVTAREYATVDEIITDPDTGVKQTRRRELCIEPLTNYFVGRVQQDLPKGNSKIGFLATTVQREGAESAYVSAVDWNLRSGRNTYQFNGILGVSRAGATEERQSGYLAHAECGKISGWMRNAIGIAIISPGFDPNDLGFIKRANRLRQWFWTGFQKEMHWAPFRYLSLNLNSWADWGLRHEWAGESDDWFGLSKGIELNCNAQLVNWWSVGGGAHYSFEASDDLTTRGGPLVTIPARNDFWIWFEGSGQRVFSPIFRFDWGGNVKGSFYRSFTTLIHGKPMPTLEFLVGPKYSHSLDKAQWITNVGGNGDGLDEHFVFGELESHTLDLTFEANITFRPNLSLRAYLQAFAAVGDYKHIKELVPLSSYEFVPFAALDFNPNFSYRSLKSNVVLRWDYRSGSTFFLIWSRSRNADTDDLEFRPFEAIQKAFSDEGKDVFLVKLSYRIGV